MHSLGSEDCRKAYRMENYDFIEFFMSKNPARTVKHILDTRHDGHIAIPLDENIKRGPVYKERLSHQEASDLHKKSLKMFYGFCAICERVRCGLEVEGAM